MQKSKFKIIISVCIVSIILPNFGLAQSEFGAAMPQTLGEAKDFMVGVLMKMPEAVKRVWNEEAMPIWQRMWAWFVDIWNRTLGPIIDSLWQKFLGLLGKEVEKRKG